MKIWILSDIHIELYWRFTRPHIDADVAVFAGDIGEAHRAIDWVHEACNGIPAIFVSGNHEYYGRWIQEAADIMHSLADHRGVHFLDNDTVEIQAGGERVRFVGSTLWTDFQLFGEAKATEAMELSARAIRDFHVIKDGAGTLTPARTVEFHKTARQYIAGQLATPFDGKTVVVTHHCPSWLSVHPRYRNTLVTAGFSSNCDDLVAQANLWIHGHTHSSVDARVGHDPERGRIICNPRGYHRHTGTFENAEFNPGLVIEV